MFNGRFLRAKPTGVQRVALQLLRAVDTSLVVRPDHSRDWRVIGPSGVVAPRFTSLDFLASGGFRGQAWEQLQLPRLARGALLVNLCNTAPLLAGRMLTMIHDAQVYTTPESYSPRFVAWYRFLLPRIGARSRLILTVSEFSRCQLAEAGVAPYERIRVIHNGVDHLLSASPDLGALAQFGLASGGYVITIASAKQHKNIQVLLRAFADPRLDQLKIVLVGPAERSEFPEATGLSPDRAIFTGPVSDSALRALLEGALCFACPSRTEGFGLPPLEAMTLGCPVIAAPCGSLPEVCGEAALYADPDAPEAWATAINRFAQSTDLWNDYALRGPTNTARFTWRGAGEALLSAIRETS